MPTTTNTVQVTVVRKEHEAIEEGNVCGMALIVKRGPQKPGNENGPTPVDKPSRLTQLQRWPKEELSSCELLCQNIM